MVTNLSNYGTTRVFTSRNTYVLFFTAPADCGGDSYREDGTRVGLSIQNVRRGLKGYGALTVRAFQQAHV